MEIIAMKKSLLALAALTAFAGAASAQSSVTMFGIVDLSATSKTAPGRTVKGIGADNYNSNRLGFRGVEDLGGGMSAQFWLEAGIDPSIGTAGGGNGNYAGNTAAANAPAASPAAFFNRRSTIALAGGFGEIRLGRDYTPTFSNTAAFDPFGYNGTGNISNILDNVLGTGTNNFVRTNNSVAYWLPGGLGGLYGTAMISADDKGTSQLMLGNKNKSVRIGYAAGPLDVAFSTGRSDGSFSGTTLQTYTVTNFGGSYDLGVAKLMGVMNIGKSNVGGKQSKTWLLGTTVPVGAGLIRLSYVKTDGSGNTAADNKDATQIGLSYVHSLSKRTQVYTNYGRISNSNAGDFSYITKNAAVTGYTSTAYEFGVKHSF